MCVGVPGRGERFVCAVGVLGVCMGGEVMESRDDATGFKTDDLSIHTLPMSRVPQRPGRSRDSQALVNERLVGVLESVRRRARPQVAPEQRPRAVVARWGQWPSVVIKWRAGCGPGTQPRYQERGMGSHTAHPPSPRECPRLCG